jgi:prepilin-type N-terminal cleavage/methylation domain-containing protein
MRRRDGSAREIGATDERGFTMIELIVVVSAIAILASIAIPLAITMETRTRIQASEKEMHAVERALVAYYEDHGFFPADLDSLETGGYMAGNLGTEDHTTDAWFRDYRYTPAALTASLVSDGPDFTASTADDITFSVSAGVVARTETRDEMETIHVALRNYESVRVISSLPALPSHWNTQSGLDGGFQMLVAEGMLPNEARFLTDSWGSTYAYGGTPQDYVTSTNVGVGP